MGPGAVRPLKGYFRLALISVAAACVATPCAAILVGLMLMALGLSADGEVIGALFRTVLLLPLIAFFSISTALDVMPIVTPPATLIGAALWELGRTVSWVRRRSIWAAVGTVFALAVLAAINWGILQDPAGMLHGSGSASVAASFAIAGAGAALIFRAGLKFLSVFFLPEDPEGI